MHNLGTRETFTNHKQILR